MFRIGSFLVLILTPAVVGQEANKLTPKQAAEGWISLFDGETHFGWFAKGSVRLVDGELSLGGDEEASLKTTSAFGAGELQFQYRHFGKRQAALALKGERVELLAVSKKDLWIDEIVKVQDGKMSRAPLTRPGQPRSEFPITPKMGDPRLSGPIEFRVPAGTQLFLRDVRFRPLETKSLFNGKDLTGWKVFPGRKSVWTVTDKGEINVKNGNGDLQTEAKFGDFLLQLECISNGEHLNSGIFFRCRPNEYQNGYEAQIRNEFTKEPTQKYVIEDYDPQTHKLLAKKEIKSTAVDYGTGAIYRRVPARKEVAKDGEWFTLTVLAHGNHFATWVNGTQVVDWTDNRPKSDNPRTGFRLEAGHISIQGHDPTTDLSFRNIRIAELGKK